MDRVKLGSSEWTRGVAVRIRDGGFPDPRHRPAEGHGEDE